MATMVQARVTQRSEATSEANMRAHTLLCDRPKEKGGSDAGPMGGELFLAGLGGCFMSNLLAAVKTRSSDISALEVNLRATLEGTPLRFTEITLSVSGRCHDKEELKKLVVIAERGCIVANTIKEAVTLNLEVV